MHYYTKRAESDINFQKDVDKDKLKNEMKALHDEADKYVQYESSDTHFLS